jgi:GDPmannose 4,6-dehydratase
MRALICGVSGQDGSYLAKFLLDREYEVFGTSRDAQTASFANHHRLGIAGRVQLESMATHDFRSVLNVLRRVEPDEIYNLAGQSSVGLSFEQPVETLDSNIGGTLNLLEGIRFLGRDVRFYNAGSGECYGDSDAGATEAAPFKPRSPYAVAKAATFWLVANYREAYSLHASTGVLFNHESPLRPERFVTRKVVAAACRIARGSKERLILGNLSVRRDWGWAPEYVDAMWRMLQQPKADDFIIATGQSHSLQEFVQQAFAEVKLDWRDHVTLSHTLHRPADIAEGRGNASKAAARLNWRADRQMPQVVSAMIRSEQALQAGSGVLPGAGG